LHFLRKTTRAARRRLRRTAASTADVRYVMRMIAAAGTAAVITPNS